MVTRVAKAGIGALGPTVVFANEKSSKRSDGVYQLRRPLPAHLYCVPIEELYSGSWWRFYTMYWPDKVNTSARVNSKLLTKVVGFLTEVVRVLAGLAGEQSTRAYPACENRSAVTTHLHRERSAKLAALARLRDGYRCRVCDIDFGQLYGKLGVGFAEVHHKIALSSPNAPKLTRVEDLVTVCANCHRMLHKMKGKGTDVQTLKKSFTAKWPAE